MAHAHVLVVIPTLGERLEYLTVALESIRTQGVKCDIALIYPKRKVKIKNLGTKYGVKHLDDPGSISAAINLGIESANQHHKFIVWIGDDDFLMPNSIATSISALESNDRAVVAFGYCDYVDENGQKIFSSKAGGLAPWIMSWGPNLVPMMGLMMRKSSLNKVGGFDTSLKHAMDLDMLLRLRKIGKFINTRKTLSAFRWHATSKTVADRPKVLDETELIKRRYLPKYMLPLAFLWEKPVRIATKIAVLQVNNKAKGL